MHINDENQNTRDPLQMSTSSITRVKAKKLQEASNGIVKVKKSPSQIKLLNEFEPTKKFKSL